MGELHAFQLEQDEPTPEPPRPAPAAPPSAVFNLLLVALKTLSQKTVIALANIRAWLLTLATAGSVFWLWMSVPDPNTNQLMGLAMYAVFILVINYIARKA